MHAISVCIYKCIYIFNLCIYEYVCIYLYIYLYIYIVYMYMYTLKMPPAVCSRGSRWGIIYT